MHTRSLILLCLGFCCVGFAKAEGTATWSVPQFKGRLWHIEHGLPRNTVQSIAQTPDGYLWIGTQSGLARFDGDDFELIPLPSTNGQTRQWVNDLCVTRDGTLWIGTGGPGLYEYKNQQLIQHLPATNLNSVILSLLETKDGALLCGTRRGLLRYSGGIFTAVGDETTERSQPQYRIALNTIRSITRGPADTYLIAVPGEILDLSADHVTSKYNMRDVNADTYIRCIFKDQDGTIWIGSNAGLTGLKDGHMVHYSKADGLPDNTVNTIYRDRQGNLWIGTYGGLCRFINRKFVITTSDDGEPYDQVFCFFEDRENNLWAGGKDGLLQLQRQQFDTLTTRHGLAHNNVISLFADRQSSLWIGTWGGGLQHVNGDKIVTYSTANTSNLRSDLILALHQRSDGSLWFATDYEGGVYRYKSNTFQQFSAELGFTNQVRALIDGPEGTLWLGTASGGLWTFDGKKRNRLGKKEGITSLAIRCFCRGKDNTFWVGTEDGLFHYQHHRFQHFGKAEGLQDSYILSLYEDLDGTLWIGTNEGGLHRRRNGHIQSYNARDGLPDSTVLEILEDDYGTFWLTSFHGITSVAKADFEKLDRGEIRRLPCRLFNKNDGMRSSVCLGSAKPSACKTSDGRLWFATTQGLCVTDPAFKLPKNATAPPVIIRQIIAGKKEVTNGGLLQIEAGRNDLEFHYTALSYNAPEKNCFRYRLDGVDTEWNDASHRKVAYYNHLAPGSYRFQVIGSNNDEVWNETGAEVRFVVQPHFWQTWWFESSLVIVGISIVGLVARILTKRRMQRRVHFLEQQHAIEKERSRIAQDMHDEVGAKLTKITFLGSVAKQRLAAPDDAALQIDKISQTARDLIGALDEIVWAVDPKNDTLENFANYLCRYASEFFDNSSVLCELRVPTELPQVSVTADVRHNLFLAIKESLTNTLKHAQATNVVVTLATEGKQIEVIISDNGVGLSPSAPDRGTHKRVGNGLRNMQHRLTSVGGICNLETGSKGTTITFRIPLK